MLFTDNVVVFMIIVFFGLYFLLKDKMRVKFIAVSSLIFYASWYPPAILLIFFHTFLGIYGGLWIEKSQNKKALFIVIGVALAPLIFFKYFNFFIDYFEITGLILPLGLSFYTFSMIGYYIDIHNKKVKASSSFVDLLLFIAFWPHLAAGPILRAKNIFNNIDNELKLNSDTLALALVLISLGLVKKLLIADNIGGYVNWNLSYGVLSMNAFEALATLLGFGIQIYTDFSGYSDMAIGFALLIGFRLQANFNYPYQATSVREFWHRWHISLSTWFRDYVYIPLGGSNNGKLRTYFNIAIVFVLSGIWHGVGWGFVVWGMLHGIFLIIEKILGELYLKIPKIIRWFITFSLVMVAWVFFRLEYNDALMLLTRLCEFTINPNSMYFVAPICIIILYLPIEHYFKFYSVDKNGYPILNLRRMNIVVLAILVFLALNFSGEILPFIYFEF
ncbi:membrane-bound O-acyltransferase (plasmid) [Campylobacter sp. RM16187]|nr:membrane-bound O-acyltransferase [Campylobacter sp. RM16187]